MEFQKNVPLKDSVMLLDGTKKYRGSSALRIPAENLAVVIS
jgi:hypothetical protein